MRWITFGAIAVTLGVLLAHGLENGSERLTRSAAPRFGSLAERHAAAERAGARAKAGAEVPTRKPDVDEQAVVEEDLRRVEDTDPADLAQAGTWREALRHYARWGDVDEKQFPAARKHLRNAMQKAENPVARQNIIFLTVRVLPLEQARGVLSPLLASEDEADVEDVICALAFAGDAAMGERFHALAQRRSPAAVAQLRDTLIEIELLAGAANADARGTLRSYRAVEVLARRNYFYLADPEREARFPYRERVRTERARELRKDWLARYAGHPGSDDVALAIADSAEWSEPALAAAWYDRAASLPDQMRTSRALRDLLRMVERKLPIPAVQKLIESGARNRSLLTYVVLRRIAAEQGCEAALDAVARYSPISPGTTIAHAWRLRRPGPCADLPRLGAYYDRVAAGRSPAERLFPRAEALPLSVDALARQFALWERCAEFDAKIRNAGPDAVVALSIDLVRFTLEHPRLFFPVYMRATMHAGKILDIHGERSRDAWSEWTARSVSAARAIVLLEGIQRRHPETPRLDEVLFLRVEALSKLLEFLPLEWVPVDNGEDVDVRPGPASHEIQAVRSAAARCREAFPQSAWTERADVLSRECRARFAEEVDE